MKPMICLTLFLRNGKKLRLESGEVYDELSNHQYAGESCVETHKNEAHEEYAALKFEDMD